MSGKLRVQYFILSEAAKHYPQGQIQSAEFNRRTSFIEQAMIIIARSNFTMVYNHLNNRILATLSLFNVHTEHGNCILDYCVFLTYQNLPKPVSDK